MTLGNPKSAGPGAVRLLRPGAVGGTERGNDVDQGAEQPERPEWSVARQRRRRGEDGHRTNRVNLRMSDAELAELAAAADRTGETPAGYAARVALAVARGELADGVDVGELREVAYGLMQTRSHLGRIGGLLNQAVTVLHSTGQPPAYLADAVARCDAAIHRNDEATQAVLRVLDYRRRTRRHR